MKRALDQAQQALDAGEFPVGCVVVRGDDVLVSGSRRGTAGGGVNEIDHAEMVALRRLTASYPDVDRGQLTVFCTLEPCLMCFGAILISGIGRIVYAYEDVMGGASACDISQLTPLYRHRPVTLVPNILRRQSLALFRSFFQDPRNRYWKGSLLERYTLAQRI